MNNILIDFGTLLYRLNNIKSNKEHLKKLKSSILIYNFKKSYFRKSKITTEYSPEDVVNIASFIATARDIGLIHIDDKSEINVNTSASENVGTVYGYLYYNSNGSKIDISSTFSELSNNSIALRNNIKVAVQSKKDDNPNNDVSITLDYSILSPNYCFTDRRMNIYECAIMAIDYIVKTAVHEISISLIERYVK